MKETDLNRRAFAGVLAGRTAAAALAVGAVSSGGACGQDDRKKKSEAAVTEKNEPEKTEPEEEEISETALLLALILKRYPDDRLDERAIQGIVRQIHSDMVHSEILGSFPLENSDEPAFAFRAWTANN